MRSLRQAIRVVSASSAAVLISGETGTYKELIARTLHETSSRAGGPFVKVRCSDVTEPELELGLFGTPERGSEGRSASGRLVEAEGGTIFFDEVADVPSKTQGRLVDAIRSMEVVDLNGVEAQPLDCRLVAATTRDLKGLVEKGEFRADLYYRLAVVPLKVPPLRSRGEDIPLLVQTCLDRIAGKGGRSGLKMPAKAISVFSHYHWPGNVRELASVVERLVTLSSGRKLDLRQLPACIRRPRRTRSVKLQLPPEGANLDDVEKAFILQALERHEGNRTHAARTLGLTRNTLLYRMRKHGLR
jgi:DNA-binding NtrC family response regulator